jgi:hypothetical protein
MGSVNSFICILKQTTLTWADGTVWPEFLKNWMQKYLKKSCLYWLSEQYFFKLVSKFVATFNDDDDAGSSQGSILAMEVYKDILFKNRTHNDGADQQLGF